MPRGRILSRSRFRILRLNLGQEREGIDGNANGDEDGMGVPISDADTKLIIKYLTAYYGNNK